MKITKQEKLNLYEGIVGIRRCAMCGEILTKDNSFESGINKDICFYCRDIDYPDFEENEDNYDD